MSGMREPFAIQHRSPVRRESSQRSRQLDRVRPTGTDAVRNGPEFSGTLSASREGGRLNRFGRIRSEKVPNHLEEPRSSPQLSGKLENLLDTSLEALASPDVGGSGGEGVCTTGGLGLSA